MSTNDCRTSTRDCAISHLLRIYPACLLIRENVCSMQRGRHFSVESVFYSRDWYLAIESVFHRQGVVLSCQIRIQYRKSRAFGLTMPGWVGGWVGRFGTGRVYFVRYIAQIFHRYSFKSCCTHLSINFRSSAFENYNISLSELGIGFCLVLWPREILILVPPREISPFFHQSQVFFQWFLFMLKVFLYRMFSISLLVPNSVQCKLCTEPP